MFEKEEQDIMSAQDIIAELKKLAEQERSENEDNSEVDASYLDEAIAQIEKFITEEEKEESDGKSLMDKQKENPVEKAEKPEKSDVVDTSVLTGPIGGLKNFLIKKSQDNAAK